MIWFQLPAAALPTARTPFYRRVRNHNKHYWNNSPASSCYPGVAYMQALYAQRCSKPEPHWVQGEGKPTPCLPKAKQHPAWCSCTPAWPSIFSFPEQHLLNAVTFILQGYPSHLLTNWNHCSPWDHSSKVTPGTALHMPPKAWKQENARPSCQRKYFRQINQGSTHKTQCRTVPCSTFHQRHCWAASPPHFADCFTLWILPRYFC